VEIARGAADVTATALASQLVRCPGCEGLNRATEPASAASWYRCHGCGADISFRKPHSLQRTVAYGVAAAILYIPANYLPTLESSRLGTTEGDTILSGVVTLWASGAYPLAALVFFASIVVPTFKLLTLSVLVVSTYRGTTAFLHERAVLYRLIEFVGRWSMLDVFVVALLVSLVQLKGVANVHAGAGAVAFAAVVVLTMCATRAFDPRLMWDRVIQ
jgi:paraquat-inducible protein A